MKRFLSIVCLAMGVTISSFAGAFNGTGTYSSDPNISGSLSATLIDFNNSAQFPVNAFSSLPFTLPTGASGITATITGTCSNNNATGCLAIGTQSAVATGFGSGNTQYVFNSTASGTFTTANTARTLTLNFTGTPTSAFVWDYLYANNAGNQITVNTTAGSTTYNLAVNPQQGTGGNAAAYFGYVGDGGATINSVTITFANFDPNAAVPDLVALDNLRLFTGSNTSVPSSSSSSSGAVPEPSTYALLGAGLSAIAYLRRRR